MRRRILQLTSRLKKFRNVKVTLLLITFALSAVLLVAPAAPASASTSTSVQPDHLLTLSGANIYFTVFNGRSSLLYNITLLLPNSLPPMGFYSGTGRWIHTLTQEGGFYRIAWFGGPVESNGSVVLGIAVIVPSQPGDYNSKVIESYQGNLTESSSLKLTIYCPCALGFDVRSLSYSLVAFVLVLPLVEIALRSSHLIGDREREE